MRRVGFISSLCLMGISLLLSACKDPYPWVDPSAGGSDAPEALSAFATAQQLEQHLKKAIREQQSSSRYDKVALEETPQGVDNNTSGSRSDAFSTTNLQEAGVDEADRLKSDGRYLYVLARQEPMAVPLEAASVIAPQPAASRIRILELGENPQSATEVASVVLDKGMRAKGTYLITGRDGDQNDLLVVLGSNDYNLYAIDWFVPWSWRSGMTYVSFLDVDNPAEPQHQTRLGFDGHLVASRRIGETLYLVTRHYPWIKDYLPWPETTVQKEENRRLLDKTTLADLLPKWQVDDGAKQAYLTSAKSCYLPPAEEDYISADVISIIAIDLRKPSSKPSARCIVGPTETVYMSQQSLYLATTRHRYVIQTNTRLAQDMVVYPPEETTEVHKFALTGSGPDYRGSAAVKGHLGWGQDKKSFRMGERDGVLFIVTSLGESWSGNATTRLTVLSEDQTSDTRRLQEMAHLPNEKRPEPIGLPGERLYAARFLGERGYLVTFRVTDPLYVLDLSEPADPFIAGSLKIPGYSDYLHPVNENMLLGIGKSAIAADSDWGDGRGAWYQGMKLALFDVSNPQDPTEVDSVEIGARGTDSDALHDHHAVTWLPADPGQGRPARLALPIKLHASSDALVPTEPWQFYPWTHTGLYLFDIYDGSGPEKRMSGIVERGQMVVESADTDNQGYYSLGDRALLKGDGIHYLHGDSIWSAMWDNPDSMVGPQ